MKIKPDTSDFLSISFSNFCREPFGIMILFRFLHEYLNSQSIFVTSRGKNIVSKLSQFLKTECMIFILRGKLNSFRFVHSAKASDSISLTLFGISMCVSILHPSNADGAIDSTSFGIIVFAQPLIRLLFFLYYCPVNLFYPPYLLLLRLTSPQFKR